jgi:hypothetical protein
MIATLEIMPHSVRLAQGSKRFRVATARMRHTRPLWWFFTTVIPGSEQTTQRSVLRTLWLSAARLHRKVGNLQSDGSVTVVVETEPDETGGSIEFLLEFEVETDEDRMKTADRMLGTLLAHSPPEWLFEERSVCVRVSVH